MSTPEANVKNKVKRILKEYGAYQFSPQTGGYGRSGIPDIIACYKGTFIAIECKAGNNKPTKLQEKELRDIALVGGYVCVINEDNMKDVRTLLDDVNNSREILKGIRNG